MGTMTLTEDDEVLLAELTNGPLTSRELAETIGIEPATIEERLADLLDNGLVTRIDESTYTITHSGVRAVAAPATGEADDRIDIPSSIEQQLASFELQPAEEDAVRAAVAFLQYWGTAHPSEIIDAIYSEHPAGYESAVEWWNACVADILARLPSVEAPERDAESWKYTEPAGIETETADGRVAAGTDLPVQPSVKFTLEGMELQDAERSAILAAFTGLLQAGEATERELQEAAYPNNDAGYASMAEWWDAVVADALASLPGVIPPGTDGGTWEYHVSSGTNS